MGIEGNYITSGTAVIEASAPGIIAEKQVEVLGLLPGDNVVIQPLQSLPWVNEFGGLNQIYLAEIDGDIEGVWFTVKSMFPELKHDVTFQYLIIAG